jgi:hypothetical protein
VSEFGVIDRLRSVKDRYFSGKANRLAAAMGCSPGYVSDLLNVVSDKKNPGRELLVNLIRHLEKQAAEEVTLDWLENGVAPAMIAKESPPAYLAVAKPFLELRRALESGAAAAIAAGRRDVARILLDLVDQMQIAEDKEENS